MSYTARRICYRCTKTIAVKGGRFVAHTLKNSDVRCPNSGQTASPHGPITR